MFRADFEKSYFEMSSGVAELTLTIAARHEGKLIVNSATLDKKLALEIQKELEKFIKGV